MIPMAPPPQVAESCEWRRVCTVLECPAHKSAIVLVPFVSTPAAHTAEADYAIS